MTGPVLPTWGPPASSPWKDGARCAVSVTFDVDGETLWISRDPDNAKRIGVLSHGTYGPRVALPMILDLLDQVGVKGTFFVPGWIIEHHRERIEAIHARGHELGHHGYLHEWLGDAPVAKEEEVLEKGIELVKSITGTAPRGYRSPAWELGPNTLDLLRKHGFEYSSNLMDDIRPYVHPGTPPLVELPVHWLLDDAPFFSYSIRPPHRNIFAASAVGTAWWEEFEGLRHVGGYFNLAMHPQFIGRPSRLAMLEGLLKRIQQVPDVWIAPLGEVARYWRERVATSLGAAHG